MTVFSTRAIARLVVLASIAVVAGCGGGGSDVTGIWIHPEEGTFEIEDGGAASLTQSGDEIPLRWEIDGDTIDFTFIDDSEVVASATVDGDSMTFRPGDWSGGEPETFRRGP